MTEALEVTVEYSKTQYEAGLEYHQTTWGNSSARMVEAYFVDLEKDLIEFQGRPDTVAQAIALENFLVAQGRI